MKNFEDFNPVAIAIFFIGTLVPVMFCMNYFLIAISFLGGAALHIMLRGKGDLKNLLFYLIFPLLGMIINPIFNHNGMTILFMANDTAITLEAALYGLAAGGMIAVTLLWFKSFSYIMTSDKLLYIFGSASPKLALILSMTLRFIPLYKRQTKRVSEASRAMGFYKEGSALDKVRAGGRIFSVMVTWGLENGVITADSMSARGYGVKRRTRYALFKWRGEDIFFLIISITALVLMILSIFFFDLGFTWYPSLEMPALNIANCFVYFLYAIFVFIPTLINFKEALHWKSLQSKI